MNISYLLSVIDLYMKKFSEELYIEVIRYDDYVKFNFFYGKDSINKTYISLDMDTFYRFSKEIFSKIQKNDKIDNEYIDDNQNYVVKINNRTITCCWFSVQELTEIRSKLLVNKKFDFSVVKPKEEVAEYDNKLLTNNGRFAFSMGFSSFITIFLTAIWFLDIFMIALWVFKLFK